jgi:tetratricopeptide (TPR) repeat protein
MRLRTILLATVGLLIGAERAVAQDDARLVEAIRLAQDGLGDSARVVVSRLLTATPPTDTLYPQILYTQGLLAKTIDERRRLYQRIAVEYATSAWADDALLRLAMQDYAEANPSGTVKNVERIRSDYPTSPLMAYAAYWGARAYFDLKKPAEACRWLNEGLAQVGDNVELQNQLSFYHGRCTNLAQAAESTKTDKSTKTDTVTTKPKSPAPATAKPESPAPATAGAGFTVQVGAVKTKSAADKLAADLRAAGFEARVVQTDFLYRVRVGHFAQRADAEKLAAKIKAKLGGGPYVVPES